MVQSERLNQQREIPTGKTIKNRIAAKAQKAQKILLFLRLLRISAAKFFFVLKGPQLLGSHPILKHRIDIEPYWNPSWKNVRGSFFSCSAIA